MCDYAEAFSPVGHGPSVPGTFNPAALEDEQRSKGRRKRRQRVVAPPPDDGDAAVPSEAEELPPSPEPPAADWMPRGAWLTGDRGYGGLLEPDWAAQYSATVGALTKRQRSGGGRPTTVQESPVPDGAYVGAGALYDGQPTLWRDAAPYPSPAAGREGREGRTGADDVMARLDALFARLETLEREGGRAVAAPFDVAVAHTDVLLLILVGCFVLLALDVLVKQGARAFLMLAAASATASAAASEAGADGVKATGSKLRRLIALL
jgi:hypothetical protein